MVFVESKRWPGGRAERSSVWVAAVSVAIFAACGSSKDLDARGSTTSPTQGKPSADGGGTDEGFGGDGSGSGNVTLDPLEATVFLDQATSPPTPASLVYRVMLAGQDIASRATFSVKDTEVGSFNGATFTSVSPSLPGVIGRTTTVRAETDKGVALGSLTVVSLRKTGPSRDFYFFVPYKLDPSPKQDVLKFSTNIKQADVAFSIDTTKSMDGSINDIKAALQTTLLPDLQSAIPNVGLAVVDFRDAGDPWIVNVRQPITTSVALAQAAVGVMTAGGGGDVEEASIASMEHILTGRASGGLPPRYGVAAHTNAPGTWGGVDFRPNSLPIVVNITDAAWYPTYGATNVATLKAAFAETKAKFVAINDTGAPVPQSDDLSDATGSHVPPSAFGPSCPAGSCCTGASGAPQPPTGPGGSCRLNFRTDGNGRGVSKSVVAAIKAIAVGTSFDVKAVLRNDPKNADGVDATKFVKALRAMDEGNASEGCPPAAATDTNGDGIKDTFVALSASIPVCFEVIAAVNTTVPPTLEAQFFNAFIDVIGVPQNLLLDTRSVLFLVPPKFAGVN